MSSTTILNAKHPEDKLFVITGGHGFIGSHIARHLYEKGADRIRIVDISPSATIEGSLCHEFIQGNLCDPALCTRVIRGAHTVLHFAANMGGMGTIHDGNDFVIYRENHAMTINILQACLRERVQCLFYASSACVYPEALQNDAGSDVSLCETDVWAHPPPKPQGLYGLEKLNSELLIQQFSSEMDIRIARFHNVFGPGGTWRGGREKAPAALLRKAISRKRAGDLGFEMRPLELWGDGSQRRSFLYIDDAVSAIIGLLESEYAGPINIGSDNSVTIKEMADLALGHASLQTADVPFAFDDAKPLGVASRNSNNALVRSTLKWEPNVSLKEGLRRTGIWIGTQIDQLVEEVGDRGFLLEELQTSQLLNLESETIVFALLLPITSRGSDPPSRCLSNLKRFAQSVNRTTWRDTHALGERQFRIEVYLAIDEDDHFFDRGSCNKAEMVLAEEGVLISQILRCAHPRGHVCKLWRDCARAAWQNRCDYMVLMGDDVTLEDEGWMRDIHAEFLRLSSRRGVPEGFGCVAFTDIMFPGMPTFPVVHRTHMDIFNGEVVPPVFINQDGDPFLFQLYRRWNCATMIPSRISNSIGGKTLARYDKVHAQDWTFQTLDDAVSTIKTRLRERACLATEMVSVDVIVPCYRVDLSILHTILQLKPSDSCTVMFIIIVDNPLAPNIAELEKLFAHRSDVRIRINEVNSGASYSRNRGMLESAADWVYFLDDDVVPSPDVLIHAEKIIRAHPDAAGFVGNTGFPPANTVFTAALHLSGVTYFWDIASKIANDVPWGVTANLIARRNVPDGVKFDLCFPRTGGGEDIDFCRQKRKYSISEGRQGFFAAPDMKVTHPWWNHGRRSYWRFYMWSVGDGALVAMYPEHCYRVWLPNSAETLFLWVCVAGFMICQGMWPQYALRGALYTIIANVVHDCYRHLWRDTDRTRNVNIGPKMLGISWGVAVIESSLIRMVSEVGRLRGVLGRREFRHVGKRFDWFAGRWGEGPVNEETTNGQQRFFLLLLMLLFLS
ncbi:glycosyltransferase family 2 protein [Gymnopus androsaceus JB14]|uniref:Glycosyltransferase family 2 protein n=1 Tax=Gymnopus androsaceus JB14 TaxID=1447944 RepID=A0A6A4HKN6_9AGAR|nr:glycosyltransferase family 2 protein [Gymnopus androsaceus JB14]